jgi:ADP-heptose:LPS heptosyltransferase
MSRRRKIILRSNYALGDIVLLTAAVRDLHRCYPNAFISDVRTSYPDLWLNNPQIQQLDPVDPDVNRIELGYPLIDFSNHIPYHAIHGYIDAINEKLGLEVHGTEFKGDIHLTEAERSAPSQVAELIGQEIPFWLISAGGKSDITIKWWDVDRYQAVLDHFAGRIQFVQVGASKDFHPKLSGAIDLRGKTSVRQLVNLVHHAQGVLCGVTGLMHLAAAVPTKAKNLPLRPCVVVAGGREPAHWEAYPHHQFIHTVGSLPCCAQGGCWKSRVVPLGDGAAGDEGQALCTNRSGLLPRCMDMISADEVIRRVESYFTGGVTHYLSRDQKVPAAAAVKSTRFNAFDHTPLHPGTARVSLEMAVRRRPQYPAGFRGRGIVICAGGVKYFTNAWVCIRMLRRVGCTLPIQIWHLGPDELDNSMRQLVAPFGVECVDAFAVRRKHPCRLLKGWELKPYAILHSPFREVLLLDADNVPVRNPEFLFNTTQFRQTGALFWPDIDASRMPARAWRFCGLAELDEPAFESGQIVVDKKRCWRPLRLSMWLNEHSDFWYQHMHGDKETFHLAWRKLGAPFSMPQRPPRGMRQHDFEGRLLFLHRNTDKWSPNLDNRSVPGFRFERECREFLRQLRRDWDMRINDTPAPFAQATHHFRPASARRLGALPVVEHSRNHQGGSRRNAEPHVPPNNLQN